MSKRPRRRRGRRLLSGFPRWPAVVLLMLSACQEPEVTWSDAFRTCRRIALVDAATGRSLRGVEDMAFDQARGLVWLSTYDRWAVEAAIETGAADLPPGGLYPLQPDRLRGDADRLVVENAARSWSGAAHLFPHGIGLVSGDPGDGRETAVLAVVNRYYRWSATTDAWTSTPTVEIFQVEAAHLKHRRTLRDPRLCNANDVVPVSDGGVLVSRDRDSCGVWGRRWETVLGLERGSILWMRFVADQFGDGGISRRELKGDVLVDGLAFANGLSWQGRGNAGAPANLFVAATRGHVVHHYRVGRAGKTATPYLLSKDPVEVFDVPGGPDNLFIDGDRSLLVAVHPSLFDLGLYRYRWFGVSHAPSRIVRVIPGTARQDILFDDPTGRLFSAATIAITVDHLLLAGSVTDAGLLVCWPPPIVPNSPADREVEVADP